MKYWSPAFVVALIAVASAIYTESTYRASRANIELAQSLLNRAEFLSAGCVENGWQGVLPSRTNEILHSGDFREAVITNMNLYDSPDPVDAGWRAP